MKPKPEVTGCTKKSGLEQREDQVVNTSKRTLNDKELNNTQTRKRAKLGIVHDVTPKQSKSSIETTSNQSLQAANCSASSLSAVFSNATLSSSSSSMSVINEDAKVARVRDDKGRFVPVATASSSTSSINNQKKKKEKFISKYMKDGNFLFLLLNYSFPWSGVGCRFTFDFNTDILHVTEIELYMDCCINEFEYIIGWMKKNGPTDPYISNGRISPFNYSR